MREHERAVRLVEVLVEAQARRGTREKARERGLSHRERVAPQVGAVQLDQVEPRKAGTGEQALAA